MSTTSKTIKLTFAEWLKLRRDIAKKTQLDIAKAINVSKQAVSKWENGTARPTLDPYQTKKFCLVLGITFDELVKGYTEEATINFL